MFEYHPSFETPEELTQVWRYMDFPSFVWVLQNSALWFSRADHFEDSWEGAYPRSTIAAIKGGVSGWDWDSFSKHTNQFRKSLFINCWYAKNYESSAMWQQYAGIGHSIAIKSTVQRLIGSLSTSPKIIHVGKVKYIDYLKDSIDGGNLFSAYLRKRVSFEHESEVRMVMWSFEKTNNEYEDKRIHDESPVILNAPKGIKIDVKLYQLIDSIYVSPKAKAWFVELVRTMVGKYDFEFEVRQSDFDSSPPS